MLDVSDIIRWLTSTPKSAWPVLAAVAAGSGLLVRLGSDLPPLQTLIAWAGMMSFCLLCFFTVDQAVGACKKHRAGKVRRRFSALSDQQKELLLERYERGHRRFHRAGDSRPRWFEELEEWNYIELEPPPEWFIAGSPYSYFVTKRGWREVQRFEEKPRRRT